MIYRTFHRYLYEPFINGVAVTDYATQIILIFYILSYSW